MRPKLWNEIKDWQLPWQWKAADGTYIAGFQTQEAALGYGRRNGWVK